MYDEKLNVDGWQWVGCKHDQARFHQGNFRRLLAVHEKQVAAWLAAPQQVLDVRPRLLSRIADDRTMFTAMKDLRERGGRAAGPNGLRLEYLTERNCWALSRNLAAAVQEKAYLPGPSIERQIPKSGKPDRFRTLTIQNAQDRIVARAFVLIIRPLVEPKMSPLSFGFRRRRSVWEALALALHTAQKQDRWTWVCADIANAFDQIPINRLRQCLARQMPDDVADFARLIADKGAKRGIRQGSPASPLLLNLYCDHYLDLPLARKLPGVALIRYADDLLIPCLDRSEASQFYEALAKQATAAGLPLKESEVSAIHELDYGGTVEWLGYLLTRSDGRLRILICDSAWDSLSTRLTAAHLRPLSPLRARESLHGWLTSLGPCYADESRDAVMKRVRQLVKELGFEEIYEREKLLALWRVAYARWQMKFEAVGQNAAHQLAEHRRWATPPSKESLRFNAELKSNHASSPG